MNWYQWLTNKFSFSGRIWIFCVFLPLFVVVNAVKLDSGSVDGDAVAYVRCAYHILKHGTYSIDNSRKIANPTAVRPPAYSWFLAQVMRVIPGLDEDGYAWVFPSQGKIHAPKNFVVVKYVQALLLLCTAFMIAWLARELTGSKRAGMVGLWCTAFHPFLSSYVNRVYVEVFGAFLITLMTAFLFLALKRRRAVFFILAGALFGAIVLSYAQWKYIWPFTLFTLLVFALRNKGHLYKNLVCVFLFALAAFAVFHPWELRNEKLLGNAVISAGGGSVLSVRAHYNLMGPEAYASSFLYWSRSPVLKWALKRFVDKKHYEVLMRDDPAGVYHKQKAYRKLMSRKYDRFIDFSRALRAEAVQLILQHPVRHILMCIPVAYRGMMNGTFSVFYIAVYALFGYGLWKAIRHSQWVVCSLLASPFFVYCFNMSVTHGLTRYNEQVTPLLVLGAIVGYCTWRRRKRLCQNGESGYIPGNSGVNLKEKSDHTACGAA